MIMGHPEQLLIALILESVLGYPAWLLARIGHPVMWAGRMIGAMDRHWNRAPHARTAGVLTAIALVMTSGAAGLLIERLAGGWGGDMAIILIATSGLAQRSLHDHVAAVVRPLAGGELAAARSALSAIVGRDTAVLDIPGMAAAATETLAESFCDGIVAPAFWFLVLGLPGLFAFKAISTADSMIGHLDARYRQFGWASARLDDCLNWLPARLAGGLICLAGGGGWRILVRDAGNHLSPNAGWPESAMAGVLGVRLGGGAAYDGEWIARETLGDGPAPGVADLTRAMSVYRRACVLLLLTVGGVAWLL
ncbi:adenosylcobinamide-phosphate synthase CbiB [Novosphingobium sp. Chol11]|uniref:adenosylcobinamide-phosphate synthase CbiB n=1 Tax=Novosphingobium sp. Chol11 TaxID=1385763 RepID=UPI00345C369D